MFLLHVVVTGHGFGFGCFDPQNDWIGTAQKPSESAHGFLRAPLNLGNPEPGDTPVDPMAVYCLPILCLVEFVMVFS